MSTSGKYLKGRFGVTPPSPIVGGQVWPLNGLHPGVPVKGMMEGTYDDTVQDLDATDSETNGYGNVDGGVKELTLSLQLLINTAEASFPGFVAGQLLNDLFLYASGFNVGPLFDCPYVLVTRASTAVQIRGQVKQSVTLKTKGVYAGPSDAVLTAGSPYKIARPVAHPDS